MKRLFLALACVLIGCVSSEAAIALVQHKTGSGAAVANTQAVTVTATISAHLLVVGSSTSDTANNVTGVSGGCTGSYAAISGAVATAPLRGELWWCASSSSGATTVTVTYTNTSAAEKNVEVWEVSGFTTPTVDVSNSTSGVTAASPLLGASVTTTAAAGFVAAVGMYDCCVVTSNPTGGNEFTAGGDVSAQSGTGFASLISASAAAHQPQWSTTDPLTGGTSGSSVAAFKETPIVSCVPTMTLLGVGRCG